MDAIRIISILQETGFLFERKNLMLPISIFLKIPLFAKGGQEGFQVRYGYEKGRVCNPPLRYVT